MISTEKNKLVVTLERDEPLLDMEFNHPEAETLFTLLNSRKFNDNTMSEFIEHLKDFVDRHDRDPFEPPLKVVSSVRQRTEKGESRDGTR